MRRITPDPSVGHGRLAELLSAAAHAQDLASAARFLVAQVSAEIHAARACVVMLNHTARAFHVVATYGAEPTSMTIAPVNATRDPVVAAAMTLVPIHCEAALPGTAFEFKRCLIIPFAQPLSMRLPHFLPATTAALAATGCAGRANIDDVDDAATIGVSPCGAFVFDVGYDPLLVAMLREMAKLAGPILSAIAAEEGHRASTKRLDAQSRLLTAIVNSLPDPIVIFNALHQIILQNRRAEQLLSMGEGDSEGRRRAVEINNLLFTSHLSKAAMSAGGPASASTSAGGRELNLVDPDEGTDLLFEVLIQPLNEAADDATVSVLRDVTDLRRAAGELERQVQRVRLAEFDAKREGDRLNLILENVADPILVTDDRSNIILMNRQAERLFGGVSSGQSVDGGGRASAVRSNDTKFTTFISDFIMSPDISRREQMRLQMLDESGGELPVEVVSGKILDKRGEPIAIVSVLHDLTKQVENERLYDELKKFSFELEARVREATADLAEQNVRLQWQSRELEQANRLKSEFLASMSHELRTPINALIGYTALMLDRIYGDITPKQEEGLSRIQIAAQHLLALINDILDLAKIEAGRMPLHLDEVTLQDIVREINMQIEPLVQKKGLTYRWSVPDTLVTLFTDRIKVKQILLNLLSNAVKFTQQGTIEFVGRVDGNMIHVDVTDTGIGIREQDLASVWDDFRQVDQSRTREFGGTGLGLSITRKLAGALGGEVSATSEFGVGSTFTVRLPLRVEVSEAPLGAGNAPGDGPSAGPGAAPPSSGSAIRESAGRESAGREGASRESAGAPRR